MEYKTELVRICPYLSQKIDFKKKWKEFSPKKKIELHGEDEKRFIFCDGEKIGEYISRKEYGTILKVVFIKENIFLAEYQNGKYGNGFSIFNEKETILFYDCTKILFYDEAGLLFSCCNKYESCDIYYYNYNYGYDFRIAEEVCCKYVIGPFIEIPGNKDHSIYVIKQSICNLFQNKCEVDVDYIENFKKPKKSLFKCKVKLNNEKIFVETSFIKKLNSEFLYSQLENENCIELPISKLDTSIECLDYLGSKYLAIKLLKNYIKDNSISPE